MTLFQGDATREARKRLRMTQGVLAGAAGVSRSTVQRLEAGLPIAHENVRAICAVLSLDVGDIDPPSPTKPVPSSVVSGPVRWLPRRPWSREFAFWSMPVAWLLVAYAGVRLVGEDRVGDLAWYRLHLVYLVVLASSCCLLGGSLTRRLPSLRIRHPASLLALAVPVYLFVGTTVRFPPPRFSVATYAPVRGDARPVVPVWKVPEGAFAQAGLQVGDIVRTMDGQPTKDFRRLVMATLRAAGRTVEMGVCREPDMKSCLSGRNPPMVLRLSLGAERPCDERSFCQPAFRDVHGLADTFAGEPYALTWSDALGNLAIPLSLAAKAAMGEGSPHLLGLPLGPEGEKFRVDNSELDWIVQRTQANLDDLWEWSTVAMIITWIVSGSRRAGGSIRRRLTKRVWGALRRWAKPAYLSRVPGRTGSASLWAV